jgi:hypothetical protein
MRPKVQRINTRTIAAATPMKNTSTMMRTDQSMLATIYTIPGLTS